MRKIKNLLVLFVLGIFALGCAGTGVVGENADATLVKMGARRVGYQLATKDMAKAQEAKQICVQIQIGELNVASIVLLLADLDDPLLVMEIQDLFILMGVDPDLGTLPPEYQHLVDPLLEGFIAGVDLAMLLS